ncbi:MAG TPA: hypothetical protein VHB98_19960 [Chloroflexota bacterium]|nr:hypothetical protein [Chloroflexota bacterium]
MGRTDVRHRAVMRRLRWLLVLLAVPILVTGGMAAWQYAHRGYADAVYYQHVVETTQGLYAPPETATEQWVDPGKQWVRTFTVSGSGSAQASDLEYILGGQYYFAGHIDPVPDPPGYQPLIAQLCQQVRDGTPRGLGAVALAHAVGTVTHLRFLGHHALRFVTTMSLQWTTPQVDRIVVWLDAASLVPLQQQIVNTDGSVATDHYLQAERLAPGTLPAGFFDPPHSRASLWDRLTGWLQDHMEGHR